ncbi:hypothetical protein Aperf_G00000122184 [Anoplocephala perfoliata]
MSVSDVLTTVACFAFPCLGGFLVSFVVSNNIEWYKSLKKPTLSPPIWVFDPMWAKLYIFMGFACLHVLRDSDNSANIILPLAIYAVQLLLNFSFVIFFFGLKSINTSTILILANTIGAAVSAYLFYLVSAPAGYLMIPYVNWMCFISYLIISIAILNGNLKAVCDSGKKTQKIN